MTFDSLDALESYILSKCEEAVKKAQLEVYAIIDRFLMEYYAEFDPVMYERTYQLLHSLVKSDVKATGNGYVAEVYFDVSLLDYSMKMVNGVSVPNKGWSEQATLESAAHGSHGGYIGGTAVWDSPLKIIDAKAIEILKKHLISVGIPLR